MSKEGVGRGGSKEGERQIGRRQAKGDWRVQLEWRVRMVYCGVVWCSVVWCGHGVVYVVWCGVVWKIQIVV